MHSRELEAYKARLKLSSEQKEVLVGLMLGDGHLETQNRGRTYRLKIEQSAKHEAYVQHLYELFKDWVRTPPQQKVVRSKGSVSANWWFQTLSHGAFRFFAQQFYQDGRKRVPKLIHRWLTPRALAYWFMDDGSIKSSQSKGVIFNTQGFERNEVQRLCDVLQDKFALEAKPRKQREGWQIYISGRSYETFRALIEPFLIPEMRYKLPAARRTQLPKR